MVVGSEANFDILESTICINGAEQLPGMTSTAGLNSFAGGTKAAGVEALGTF